MKAFITDFKRFAVHDGDGIRTTVFLKGCPLKCVWCHNPESIPFDLSHAYYSHKCVNCGSCKDICEANTFDTVHHFDREKCIKCGKCISVCPHEAFSLYGKYMDSDEVLSVLLEDAIFYASSGGGITLSGGECLMQADFCAELLEKCKENGLQTAVDTCGFVSKDALDKVIPFTDMFLYDVKAFDEDVHIKCTGQSNKIILENLKYLDDKGCKIEIRIPYVPEYNDDQIPKIAEFLSGLKNITKVRVLPYHSYAGSKYEALGMENTLPAKLPTDEEIKAAEKYFE